MVLLPTLPNKIDLLHMNLFWIATLAAGKAEHKAIL